VNGMSVNGMSVNGMSVNGMSVNGLTAAALGAPAFGDWFEAAPEMNEILMKYVVRCGAPADQSFSYTSPVTGQTLTWMGNLGLTPGWIEGQPISDVEQQLVSACLAAHVNKFGIEIPIAVEGLDAAGQPIARGPTELEDYPEREACFFGNVFTGEGLFSGIDHAYPWSAAQSSKRACAFDPASVGSDRDCPPILNAGECSQLCVPTADGIGWETCTVDGKTYRPLATRFGASALSTCGDGRCDPQERCGAGTSWDSCAADCGACQ